MVELIPVLRKWFDGSLYLGDFYIDFVSRLNWYERSGILHLMSWTSGDQKILLFLMFYICCSFFVWGVIELASQFINNPFYQIFIVFLVLFIFPYSSVGGNELFYPMFSGSSVAKTIGVWSFYFYLRDRYAISGFLVGVSSLFQALFGFQLAILISASFLLNVMIARRYNLNGFILFIFSTLLIIVPNFLALIISQDVLHMHGNLIMDLLEFRVGHHFFIKYSGAMNIFIYIIIFVVSLILWKNLDKRIWYFLIIQTLILILYVIDEYVFKSGWMIKTQWLKTTIWIEFFFGIGLLKFLSKQLRVNFFKLFILLFFLLFIPLKFYKILKNVNNFGEERELSEWVKAHTPKSALFIVPFQFTCFKTYAERGLWVDYKSVCHQIAYLAPWYDRINKVYGLSIHDRINHVNYFEKANQLFRQRSESDWLQISDETGVDFFVIPIPEKMNYTKFEIQYHSNHYLVLRRILTRKSL